MPRIPTPEEWEAALAATRADMARREAERLEPEALASRVTRLLGSGERIVQVASNAGTWPQSSTNEVSQYEYTSGECPHDDECASRRCPNLVLCAIDRAAKYLGDARYIVIDRHGYRARALKDEGEQ